MEYGNRWLILITLFAFWITISEEQYVCNDTAFWSNNYNHPCHDYEFNVSNHWWCPNGTYIPSTKWTGGGTYNYPEFNCCACGKGWPLWFAPAAGSTATKAVPTITMNITNNITSDKLVCHDAYRNITACTMKCKALTGNATVTSPAAIDAQDFNQSHCTLDLNMENDAYQYILHIPIDNYLIYFTNWTVNNFNLSCVNSTGLMTSHMLCRYEVDDQPFSSFQCPSNNITSRYIQPDCVDTKNWTTASGNTCFDYEIVWRWCTNRQLRLPSGSDGSYYKYADLNCCACGKGSLSLVPTSMANNAINSSEFGIIHLQNCSTFQNNSYIFDMKCLGSLYFINTHITMNATLYNCPLNCFFDWNTTLINQTQSIDVSRQLNGSSVSYYFTPNVLSRYQIVCTAIIDQDETSTDFSSIVTTSEAAITSQPTVTTPGSSSSKFLTSTDFSSIVTTPEAAITSQPTVTTPSSSSSESPTATQQSIAWQPKNCTNGKIGLNCNISVDTCLMAEPCLNNGTCLNTNASYICLCPPSKFTGIYCEIDIRPCKLSTCLSHGTCIEINSTSFLCQCEPGYEGIHCESLINYCLNVNCQNNGQCRPSRLNFTCECTSKDFSGRYCQIKSSSLAAKQTINRSFGYIAIVAIIFVGGIIIFMDILKYGFNIDPVAKERKRLQAKKRLKSHRPIPIRYIYVHKTIPE